VESTRSKGVISAS